MTLDAFVRQIRPFQLDVQFNPHHGADEDLASHLAGWQDINGHLSLCGSLGDLIAGDTIWVVQCQVSAEDYLMVSAGAELGEVLAALSASVQKQHEAGEVTDAPHRHHTTPRSAATAVFLHST
jgi:hypothetical protein